MNRASFSLLFFSLFAAPSSATSPDSLMSVPNSVWSDMKLLNEQFQVVRETYQDAFDNTHDHVDNDHGRSLQLRQLCNIVIELFDAVAPANENRECDCDFLQRSLTCHYEAVECQDKILPSLDITMATGLKTTVDICQEFQEDEFERVCVEADLTREMRYDVCQKATMGFGDDITACSCTVCDEFNIQVDCTDRHPLAKSEGCQRIFFEDTCLDFAPTMNANINYTDSINNNTGSINVPSFDNDNNITGFSRFFQGSQAEHDGRGGNFTEYDNDNNITGFSVSRNFDTPKVDDDDDDTTAIGFAADGDDDGAVDDDTAGFAVRNETETPQQRATNWTAADPNTYSSSKQIQRYAMAALYYSTTVGGMQWFRSDDWLSYEVDECEWFSNSSDYPCSLTGELEVLDLTDNLLYGPLAPEIGYLRTLQQLFLGYNSLSGILPTTIGSLTNLIDLDLAATDLYGTLPTELGLLTNLESLSLQFNWFNGTIPSELGLLTNAFSIELFSNDLTGSVPTEICELIANNGTEVYVDCGATNCTCGCMCTSQVSK